MGTYSSNENILFKLQQSTKLWGAYKHFYSFAVILGAPVQIIDII
jgi:hypothetical protein